MSLIRSLLHASVLLVCIARVAGAGPAPVFWVGAGPPCNFQTLQTAIGAVPDGAILHLASNQAYDDINVMILDKSLTIQGGYADCTGTPSNELTVLTGAAAGSAPVLLIDSGTFHRDVVLRYLAVRGGLRGGIEVSGYETVSIERSRIDANDAPDGGGVRVLGVAPDTTLLKLTESIVGSGAVPPVGGNHADGDGGGIYCTNATVQLRGAAVRGNQAAGVGGAGGGIYLEQCVLQTGYNVYATAELGPFTALVSDNLAAGPGGGIYASDASILQLGPASDRIAIEDNHTTYNGGGVYLHGAGTQLTGDGISIDGNVADAFGGAGYVTESAQITLKRNTPPPPPAPAAGEKGGFVLSTGCSRPVECSTVSGNRAEANTGGAFYVAGASLTLLQTLVSANYSEGGSVLLVHDGSVVRIENSLIAANDANGFNLVRVIDGSSLAINSSTIAGNATGATLVRLFSDGGANNLFLGNSIVWQPDTTVLQDTLIDTVTSTCMNAHENLSIIAQTHDPGFVDAADGDYRLHAGSANIDACTDPFALQTVDILGRWRPTDLGPDHGSGDFDRGAYELPDRIFADGFDAALPAP